MNRNPLSSDYLTNFSASLQQPIQTHPRSTQKQWQKKIVTPTKYYSPLNEAHFRIDKGSSSHLAFFREGSLLAYTCKQKRPWGPAILLMPDGTSAFFSMGLQLHGWACVRRPGSFLVLASYKQGRFEGPQFIHDLPRKVLMETLYSQGQLHSVVRCCSAEQMTFSQLLPNKALIQLTRKGREEEFFKNNFPWVQCPLGCYYGEMDAGIPSGIGLLKADNDIFVGQFDRGLLHGQGIMTLSNGDHYSGDFEAGSPKGLGFFNRKGEFLYKLHGSPISSDEFNSLSPLPSFGQSQLSLLFGPIVSFCLKLAQIYPPPFEEQRFQEEEVSLVDIQVEGEATDRRSFPESSSSPPTDRIELQPDPFHELIRSRLPTRQQVFQESQASKQEERKVEKKVEKKDKKKKILATDREWDQVIEELQGEESIGREDGFLRPEAPRIREGEEVRREDGVRGTLGRPMRENIVRLQVSEKEPKEEDVVRLIDRLVK